MSLFVVELINGAGDEEERSVYDAPDAGVASSTAETGVRDETGDETWTAFHVRQAA